MRSIKLELNLELGPIHLSTIYWSCIFVQGKPYITSLYPSHAITYAQNPRKTNKADWKRVKMNNKESKEKRLSHNHNEGGTTNLKWEWMITARHGWEVPQKIAVVPLAPNWTHLGIGYRYFLRGTCFVMRMTASHSSHLTHTEHSPLVDQKALNHLSLMSDASSHPHTVLLVPLALGPRPCNESVNRFWFHHHWGTVFIYDEPEVKAMMKMSKTVWQWSNKMHQYFDQ